MKNFSLLTLSLLFNLLSYSQACTIPDSFFIDDTVVVCQATIYRIDGPIVQGATYVWSTSEGSTFIDVTFNGKYSLQVSDGNCTKSDSITVLFNSFLLSPQVEDLKLCKGWNSTPLNAGGSNILWYNAPLGGTALSTAPVPGTADTSTTTYWATQTTKGCESPRIPMTVKVIDKPMFELGEAFIIPCDATGIVLQIIPDGESSYTWSNGSDESSIVATARGRYWLYAENMCGNHSDSVVAVECKDKCVQLPTAFTPNRDGKNDIFKPACFCPVSKYRLTIYNRNGEQVFPKIQRLAGTDITKGSFSRMAYMFSLPISSTLCVKRILPKKGLLYC
jgi:hypothetical protein